MGGGRVGLRKKGRTGLRGGLRGGDEGGKEEVTKNGEGNKGERRGSRI
jgi:hypothetical protein